MQISKYFFTNKKPTNNRFLQHNPILRTLILFLGLALSLPLFAHGVDEQTKLFIQNNVGANIIPFMYIGAKHMITGYDHLLFLFGVIFFLFKTKDILIFVSLFTLGHSSTLLLGVLAEIKLNAYLIDAVIALSIVYKGFDNLGGFRRLLGFSPNAKVVVFIFGLFHGFGLATKLQEFDIPKDGLLSNLLAFNVGVEFGQFAALAIILILISAWRRHSSFLRFATASNTLLMSAGFLLMALQLTSYFLA